MSSLALLILDRYQRTLNPRCYHQLARQTGRRTGSDLAVVRNSLGQRTRCAAALDRLPDWRQLNSSPIRMSSSARREQGRNTISIRGQCLKIFG